MATIAMTNRSSIRLKAPLILKRRSFMETQTEQCPFAISSASATRHLSLVEHYHLQDQCCQPDHAFRYSTLRWFRSQQLTLRHSLYLPARYFDPRTAPF